jgi:hypothetical protein
MADFHQEGIITTVHALYRAFDRKQYLKELEKKIEEYASHLKISLLLPSLYSEIQNPEVLDNIINEIQKVRYLSNVLWLWAGRRKRPNSRRQKNTLQDSVLRSAMLRLCGWMGPVSRKYSGRYKIVRSQQGSREKASLSG